MAELEENPMYATAANFGSSEEVESKRPWVKEVTVPQSIKRKYPSKHYVYKVIVKWTNGAETVIYRRYTLFFDFVVKLQELVAKLRQINPKLEDTDLQLPELPGKVLFGRSQTHQVAEKRRRKVEDFCQQLILLPPEISESGLVLGFFNTWPDDTLLRDHSPGPEHVISAPILVSPRSNSPAPLLKSANRSSLVSSDVTTPTSPPTQEGKEAQSSAAASNSMDSIISHPDEMEHLEQYRVLGNYERKDSHQVDLYAGQIVHVIEKHDTGWWMVMSEDEQGYAPAAYLEPLDETTRDRDVHPQKHSDEVYEAMEAYVPVSEDEVGFRIGDRIKIIAKSMDGWWKIRCNGQTGFAPAALIRRINDSQKTHVDNGFESERAIYEELNIHHPPPRRNTLNQSAVSHVAPGYLSPRSHPELAGVMEENIYCEPAEESPDEDEERHIYKVPRLSTESKPSKLVKQHSQDTESSRSASESSTSGYNVVRKGSANSHQTVSSPKPVSPALQSSSELTEREQALEGSVESMYENVSDALDKSQTITPQPQTGHIEHATHSSAQPPPISAKPTLKPKPTMEDAYVRMDSAARNAPVRTRSGSKHRTTHSVDDYEDLDAVSVPQMPLLPAMDDYVDMAGDNPVDQLKKSEELSRATPTKTAPPPPPRGSNKATPTSSKSSVSRSFSIDPLPPVFGEDEYIDMDIPPEDKSKSPPIVSPPPRDGNKPRSARPIPPPPYSQPGKGSGDQGPQRKNILVRAKSLEDLLSAAHDQPDLGSRRSPPLVKKSLFAPPLPTRNPPTERPVVDTNLLPTKPRPGKTRNPIKRKPVISNGEFKWPDSSSPAPPVPKPRPGHGALDRSISPVARQSVSPPGIRERSPHPPLSHTVSENIINERKSQYVAEFSFTAPSDHCVSFSAGERCELVKRAKDSGWWLVKIGDKVGWTPADYWKESTRDRSVTNATPPSFPPPVVRKPRSHTVAEINTTLESSGTENSLQDSLQDSFSMSSSYDGELSPPFESSRHQAPPPTGAKPSNKGKVPPPKPRPMPDAGSPVTGRKPKPVPPQKYNVPGSRNGGPPPPLPPANATRKLGSHSSQEHLNGGVTSPTRPAPPAKASPERDGDYLMLNDASTESTSIENAVWFAGKMERVQAESFLMEHGRQREFLVRERTTKHGYYALSVRYHYNIRHFNIDPTPDGQYCMGTLVFTNIDEIIKHYQHNSLFIHDNQHVTLGQAVAVKKRGRADPKANGV